jgi:hypothetical protein
VQAEGRKTVWLYRIGEKTRLASMPQRPSR